MAAEDAEQLPARGVHGPELGGMAAGERFALLAADCFADVAERFGGFLIAALAPLGNKLVNLLQVFLPIGGNFLQLSTPIGVKVCADVTKYQNELCSLETDITSGKYQTEFSCEDS